MKVTVNIRRDNRRSLELLALAPRLADEAIEEAAAEMHGDIDGSWSSSSPSAPGEPPAVVTAALKQSGKHMRLEPGKWQVQYGGPGAEYAILLEFGAYHADTKGGSVRRRDESGRFTSSKRMAARPFFRPAIQRLRKRLGKIVKVKFEGALK